WKKNGWDGETPVWRVEFRFTRSFFRNLTTPIESPYELLSRLKDIWEYAAGRANGGEDGLPDGWLRYVISTDDTNRSRWPVRPEWQVIQAAFDDECGEENGLGPIVRERQRQVNVERGIASVTGYMSTLAAWMYDLFTIEGLDVSLVLHWLYEEMESYLLKKERDFQKLVIEKRLCYELPIHAA
ncbi:MAG: hypothetical protein M3Z24_13625, partial [Chloroflexota bacterium]|nr:hypothetical protein [Chloroflexota bacterium]